MARIIKKTRIARNPRRLRRIPRNAKGRFLKRSTVRRKRTHKRATAKRRHTRRNPPILIELGAINPRPARRKRRSSSMAKRRTRRNARRRRVARAVNPRRRRRVHRRRRNAATPVRRRRRVGARAVNPRRRRRTHHRRVHRRGRRRNPQVFGHGGKSLIEMTGGVLVGVAATKYLPTLIPQSIRDMVPAAGGLGGVAVTGVGAFAAQWIAKKLGMGPAFSDAVLLGGLAMTASQLLNIFAPPSLSSALALSGMGDIVPGYFPVPQNSVTSRAPVVAMPGVSGMGRAFPRRVLGAR